MIDIVYSFVMLVSWSAWTLGQSPASMSTPTQDAGVVLQFRDMITAYGASENELAASLGADELFVVFQRRTRSQIQGAEHKSIKSYVMYLFDGRSVDRVAELGPCDALDRAIRDYSLGVEGSSSQEATGSRSEVVLLQTTAVAMLLAKPGIKRIIILLTGTLSMFPWDSVRLEGGYVGDYVQCLYIQGPEQVMDRAQCIASSTRAVLGEDADSKSEWDSIVENVGQRLEQNKPDMALLKFPRPIDTSDVPQDCLLLCSADIRTLLVDGMSRNDLARLCVVVLAANVPERQRTLSHRYYATGAAMLYDHGVRTIVEPRWDSDMGDASSFIGQLIERAVGGKCGMADAVWQAKRACSDSGWKRSMWSRWLYVGM